MVWWSSGLSALTRFAELIPGTSQLFRRLGTFKGILVLGYLTVDSENLEFRLRLSPLPASMWLW